MPEPHLMGISTESSDSSDVEILRSPIIKNKNDAAGDSIPTQAPKIIPRVEITEDADADPRFQQPSEKTKATEANPIQTSKEDLATNPTKEGDADLVGNKAGKDGPTMEEEKASDDQNTIAKILKESRQEVPSKPEHTNVGISTKASGKKTPTTKPKSRIDIDSLEKEDPAGALDCLITQILNGPSPDSMTS